MNKLLTHNYEVAQATVLLEGGEPHCGSRVTVGLRPRNLSVVGLLRMHSPNPRDI